MQNKDISSLSGHSREDKNIGSRHFLREIETFRPATKGEEKKGASIFHAAVSSLCVCLTCDKCKEKLWLAWLR